MRSFIFSDSRLDGDRRRGAGREAACDESVVRAWQ
jgi:hypothetical protein